MVKFSDYLEGTLCQVMGLSGSFNYITSLWGVCLNLASCSCTELSLGVFNDGRNQLLSHPGGAPKLFEKELHQIPFSPLVSRAGGGSTESAPC